MPYEMTPALIDSFLEWAETMLEYAERGHHDALVSEAERLRQGQMATDYRLVLAVFRDYQRQGHWSDGEPPRSRLQQARENEQRARQ